MRDGSVAGVIEAETDLDCLRQIELLALDVVGATDPAELERAVGDLGRLRHWHFNGDGCVDPDRPWIAAVVTGWVVPVTRSPGHAEAIGWGGR